MGSLEDPLQPILDLVGVLTDVQAGAEKLQPLADDLKQGLGELEQALAAPVDLGNDLSELDSLLGDILDLVEVLSEVEGLEFLDLLVDPIQILRRGVGDVQTVLGDLDDALEPVQKVLDKFDDPVADVDRVVTYLDQHSGVWLRQLNLIDDSVQVAEGVALLVQGDFGSELDKIVAVYTDLAASLDTTVSPLGTAVTDLETTLGDGQAAVAKFVHSFQGLVTFADDVDHAFQKISFLKPILTVIHDALIPVQWALDAVACIFDKIVQPILDAVVPQSFRNELQGLFDRLIDVSGIEAAVDDVKSFVAQSASELTAPLDGLISQASSLASVNGTVAKALDSHLDASFDQQLATLAKALGDAPKNTHFSIDPYSTGYDHAWGIASNLLHLLDANSNDHEVHVVIATVLGAGDALISGNQGAVAVETWRPPAAAASAPTPDAVAFWLKIESYLQLIESNTTNHDVLVAVDAALGAGNGYFQTGRRNALTNPGDHDMQTPQTLDTPTTGAQGSSGSTGQFVIQILAELYPALDSVVALIVTKVPDFKVPGDAIMGALQGFLQGEGYAIDTKYEFDATKAQEYFIQLNNIKAPTVTDSSGTSYKVTPVTNSADAALNGGAVFCRQWPMVESVLNQLLGMANELPPELRAKFDTVVEEVEVVGTAIDAELCHGEAS